MVSVFGVVVATSTVNSSTVSGDMVSVFEVVVATSVINGSDVDVDTESVDVEVVVDVSKMGIVAIARLTVVIKRMKDYI